MNEHSVDLITATSDQIITIREADLYIRLGGLDAMPAFFVVESLSVNIPIGTDFMNGYVRKIYSTGKPLKPRRSRPINIYLVGVLESCSNPALLHRKKKNEATAITSVKGKWEHRQVENREEDLSQAQ